MVFSLIGLDSVDNSGGPFDDQILQPIPLIKVGIHVLFHSLSGLSILLTLLIILCLGGIHVCYQVFQLPQRQLSMPCNYLINDHTRRLVLLTAPIRWAIMRRRHRATRPHTRLIARPIAQLLQVWRDWALVLWLRSRFELSVDLGRGQLGS